MVYRCSHLTDSCAVYYYVSPMNSSLITYPYNERSLRRTLYGGVTIAYLGVNDNLKRVINKGVYLSICFKNLVKPQSLNGDSDYL